MKCPVCKKDTLEADVDWILANSVYVHCINCVYSRSKFIPNYIPPEQYKLYIEKIYERRK